MRIISGSKRGATIKPPSNLPVRPITDRNKESLFNILANDIDFEEVTVLDLFTGAGNVAFEFASRGAEYVLAVDSDSRCVKFVREQTEKFEFDNLEVEQSDVLQFIGSDHRTYDVIFADPPFNWPDYEKMIRLIFSEKLLKDGGILITEHYHSLSLDHIPGFSEKRKYGQTIMSFFRYPEKT